MNKKVVIKLIIMLIINLTKKLILNNFIKIVIFIYNQLNKKP